MKSIFAIAALTGASMAMRVNSEFSSYPEPRRLDTNLMQFVDDLQEIQDDQQFVQTSVSRRPHQKEMLGVRFIDQNDNAFNDELYKYNNVTYLGDHGFLIQANRIDYSGYKRKIEGEEDVKALI